MSNSCRYPASHPKLEKARKTAEIRNSLPRGDAGVGLVYFMRRGSDGAIKIGRSTQLQIRYRDLVTRQKQVLDVLHYSEELVEKRVHRLFAHLHIGGEWHRPAPELLQYIDALKLVAAA